MNAPSWKLVSIATAMTLASATAFANTDATDASTTARTKIPTIAPTTKVESTCPKTALHTGSYLGAQLGYGSYRVRNTIGSPGGVPLTTSLVEAANGWSAGVALGYGQMINEWFYLGGEVFINANNMEQNFNIGNTAPAYTYSNLTYSGPTYGIGLLPGIRITESTLTYGRLGWNEIVMKTEEAVTGGPNRTRSIARSGFVFGIGIETLIADNYSLRGEFDHTYFSSYNTFSVYNTLVDSSSNQFMMTVLYHFN